MPKLLIMLVLVVLAGLKDGKSETLIEYLKVGPSACAVGDLINIKSRVGDSFSLLAFKLAYNDEHSLESIASLHVDKDRTAAFGYGGHPVNNYRSDHITNHDFAINVWITCLKEGLTMYIMQLQFGGTWNGWKASITYPPRHDNTQPIPIYIYGEIQDAKKQRFQAFDVQKHLPYSAGVETRPNTQRKSVIQIILYIVVVEGSEGNSNFNIDFHLGSDICFSFSVRFKSDDKHRKELILSEYIGGKWGREEAYRGDEFPFGTGWGVYDLEFKFTSTVKQVSIDKTVLKREYAMQNCTNFNKMTIEEGLGASKDSQRVNILYVDQRMEFNDK